MNKQADHMARRHSQLKSVRKTADEFSVSKSTVHRRLQAKAAKQPQDAFRQGYTRLTD